MKHTYYTKITTNVQHNVIEMELSPQVDCNFVLPVTLHDDPHMSVILLIFFLFQVFHY